MKFDLPKDQSSIIKVIGVGGGGSNAINHMYNQGIEGVDFIVCNTDAQALEQSPVPNKVQLGTTLTEGLGAGANPEVGKNAALEDIEQLKSLLEANTKMVFITAGMGGGTGTGAAPVIAETAKELGILTVGIVTVPFSFEGRRRKQQADSGLEALRQYVDTLLIINNDKLRMIHGNLKMSEAFSKADDILTTAAKSIAEIITVAGYINVDFEDVKTVMKDGGTAIMGSAEAEGEDRAIKAVTNALLSPLLNDNEIKGADHILLNITSGEDEISMDEIDEITEFIQNESGYTAEIIWGNGIKPELGGKISVTVIATGFGDGENKDIAENTTQQSNVRSLDEDLPTIITQKIDEELPTEDKSQTEGASNDVVEEQAAFSFSVTDATNESEETNNQEVEDEVEEKEIIRFSLDDDDDAIESKRLGEDVEETEVEPVDSANTTTPNTEIDNTSDDTIKFSLDIEEETNEEDDTTGDMMNENEEATSFSWNLSSSTEEEKEEEPTVNNDVNAETTENTAEEGPVYTNRVPDEDQLKRSQERINKIKALGMKMKTPTGINDLEKEPAYKRRKVDLEMPPHSSESSVSKYSLTEDEDGTPKLKDNNSFLHDNVD